MQIFQGNKKAFFYSHFNAICIRKVLQVGRFSGGRKREEHSSHVSVSGLINVTS